MGKVRLAFCIYAENPYGDSATLAEERYTALFDAALRFGERLNACFGRAPRTYACVGSHIEAFAAYAGDAAVRKLYASKHGEVANHTYSHSPIMPVQGLDGWYPRKVLTPAETAAELRRTNSVLASVLKRRGPFGFSAPCGYPAPLSPEVVRAVKTGGCAYSHSYTRGPGGAFFTPLCDAAGNLRQPFHYSNGLLEIPQSGWQDVFNFPPWFRLLHQLRFGTAWPRTEREILAWWGQFLDEAVARSDEHGGGRDIALTYMLHPAYLAGIPFIDRWGFRHGPPGYDPALRVLAQQLDLARARDVRVVTMSEIAAAAGKFLLPQQHGDAR